MDTRQYHSRLGTVMRVLRTANRLSQQDVAAACGVSRPHITQIESGDVGNVAFLTVVRFAELFGMSVEELHRMVNEYDTWMPSSRAVVGRRRKAGAPEVDAPAA